MAQNSDVPTRENPEEVSGNKVSDTNKTSQGASLEETHHANEIDNTPDVARSAVTSESAVSAPSPEEILPPSFLPVNPPSRLEAFNNNVHVATQHDYNSDSQDAHGEENEEETDDETKTKKRSLWRNILDFFVTICVVLALSSLLKTFVIQAFSVPSGSMESTLVPGDKFFVNRMATSEGKLRRGDIIVFVDPGGWLNFQEPDYGVVAETGIRFLRAIGLVPGDSGHYLVKRIIGKGGDTVTCCDAGGKLTVNGTPITETYLDPGVAPSLEKFSVKIPEGHLWMMGDNRSNSKDSRWHHVYGQGGFVPVDNVVGRAWLIFSPWSNKGFIKDESSVFANVPKPANKTSVRKPSIDSGTTKNVASSTQKNMNIANAEGLAEALAPITRFALDEYSTVAQLTKVS
ncbi:signal peptidase I [Actinotignum urinale]|uniref:Signal peptidase I n=1 Tax=Actinotignum urinale TaxID=190146 RepID=A0ABU5G648_9ACTO|nr:signal peptidase I [Actinotignum urinale]MDY5132374.1 signal peptidase I [Actinotignum urinale]MDY5160741.1 signal peptidase I [Actinotignum urinale]